ncbi:hypothetical protein KW782_01415 [Candidatus Parcubacteria bacterium]|nr:hypothetical protein [Candidatus Parcubacteria bacterium]
MKRNALIIVGIIIIIVAGIVWSKYLGPQENILSAFTVEEGTFVANAKNASKIEVLGVLEGKKLGKDSLNLGTMELVEKNDAGEQTWILATPNETEKRPIAEIYAIAYNTENSEAGKRALPQKGKEAIASAVWPAPVQMTIFGLVRELSGNTLRLSNGGSRELDIVLTLDSKIQLSDQNGKPITRAKLVKNAKIAATGTFIDEQKFNATQIELNPPQLR